jgi:hypothetical protein
MSDFSRVDALILHRMLILGPQSETLSSIFRSGQKVEVCDVSHWKNRDIASAIGNGHGLFQKICVDVRMFSDLFSKYDA